MAFLIYSRDVGNDMPKALDTVIHFFGGRRYYDANNVAGAIEANQAGSETNLQPFDLLFVLYLNCKTAARFWLRSFVFLLVSGQ